MAREIKLLGKLTITEEGQLSPLMKNAKGCALLAYLVVSGSPQSREAVADLLWESLSTAHSLRNLRVLLTRIRPFLPELQASRQTLAIQINPDTTIDLHQLNQTLSSMETAQLEQALFLYEGHLLEDLHVEGAPRFNEWLLLAREKLKMRLQDIFRQVCEAHAAQERWRQGIIVCRRWLALDDLNEEAYRRLMQMLAGVGEVGAALQQYEACRQRLHAELDVEPEAATTELARQLMERQEALGGIQLPQATLPELPSRGELAEPGLLPVNACVPFRRNDGFTGREADLLRLAELLLPWPETAERATQPAAITGMGGLGKTQLAVEFCYRYGRFYPGGVFWLSFAEAENVAEAVAAIGTERGLGLFHETEQLSLRDRVGRVQRAWQEPIPRLLVFDNCEDEDLLAAWLPVTGGCHILMTSRRARWSRDFGAAVLSLPVLQRAESVRLLQHLAPRLVQTDAGEIAAEVGDLPLAIYLAGNFLHRYPQVSAAAYLAQLRDQGLLEHPSLQGRGATHSPTGHELHVARTFTLSLDRLNPQDEVDRMAQRLLSHVVCFAPSEPVPQDLLRATVLDDEDFAAILLVEDGLARLASLGFLAREGQASVILHRLLAAFIQNTLAKEVFQAAQADVGTALINMLVTHRASDPILVRLPFPAVHLRHITQVALGRADLQAAQLATLWGSHLFTASEYDRAQPYLAQALTIRQRLLEPTAPEVLESLARRGRLYFRLGDYNEAAALFKQALSVRESLAEQDLPEMALILRDLGALYGRLAEYDKALLYHERELLLRRQHFGSHHILVAQSLSSLGTVYGGMGKYSEARAYQEESLAIYEQSADQEEAVIARLLNNLSTTCYRQGDYHSARAYMERTLQIREKIFAENHYYVGSAMATLGYILMNLGEFAAAQPYLDKACLIQEEKLGRQHLLTVRAMTHRGNWLFHMGEIEAAQTLLTQVLAVQETIKPIHGQAADILNLLGEIYTQQGALAEARPFLEKSLHIWRQLQKGDTLEIAHLFILLGEWHQANGEAGEARSYYEQALAILEKSALPTHNDICRVEKNLATATC